MAQSPQLNDSQLNLLAKIAANTGETQPKHGDGQHNLLFKIAQNTYASAVNSSSTQNALQQSGDGYVVAQQGDSLAAKYAEAKAKSPSATNRVTLFVVPGTYSLSSELAIDAEYVDIVGLGAQFQSPAVIVTNNTLNVTANDVRVSGVSVGTQSFKIGNDKTLQIFENCSGGENSFGSFGSFVRGKFMGCVASGFSFGGDSGTADGIFVNCIAGVDSFGGAGGEASGSFKSCVGGSASFGGGGVLTGELISCRLIGAGASYETPSDFGIIRFCLDGDNNIVNADAP